jgi:CheY-like chemotaxis protein
VLRRGVGEDINIELNLGRGLGDVSVDAGEFEAALLNLVVNARDAMPHGGRIVIRTRDHAQKEAEGRRQPGRYVLVTVEDTGTGMAPEVIEHAMEPFFTTKDVGKGSGLGLSQVYGFAVQSGGDVTIESREGHGTTVSFYLPVRHNDRALDEGDSGAPVKVLLVEDDADVQTAAIETLRYLGYAVLTADEGMAALDILHRDPDIHILFTDVVMPKGMSGVDLLNEARKLRPNLKVLLASGYARGQLPTIPPGCDFIAKPYRVEELEKRLRAMVGARPPGDAG